MQSGESRLPQMPVRGPFLKFDLRNYGMTSLDPDQSTHKSRAKEEFFP
jgi:hypothetical protein